MILLKYILENWLSCSFVLYFITSFILLSKLNSEIDSFDDILEIIDTKIISIGSNKYLALIKVNYEDTLTDPEIIDLNQRIETKIKNVDPRFSHLYIIPA